VARPRIKDGGQHHFIFQRRPGGRGDGFQRLQRIGNDAAANNDLIGWLINQNGLKAAEKLRL
jgi:hypothetical protein